MPIRHGREAAWRAAAAKPAESVKMASISVVSNHDAENDTVIQWQYRYIKKCNRKL